MKKFYTLLITAIFGFAFSQNTVYFTGGTFNWQFPPLVTTAQVSAWGGGGGGGSVNNSNGAKTGGGGGGGAFAQSAFTITPGNLYSGYAGFGGAANSAGEDSYWVNNTTILAKGGLGGGVGSPATPGAGGAGGSATNSIGTTKFAGGNGATGFISNYSGGGGGSAGSTGNGGNASGSSGGSAGTGTPQGAAGASGRVTNGPGVDGNIPGSGGSGSYRGGGTQSPAGGLGGNGRIQIDYTGYCRPLSASNATYINALSTTGGVTNISKSTTGYGAYGYQNWYYDSNGSVSAYAGNTFTVTFNLVGGTAGVAIWIDWNKNNSFDASERVYNSAAYLATGNTTTPAITVPVGTTAGDYVMRIVTDYWSMNPDSCTLNASGPRGEGEDYKLTVLALPACSGTPTGGTTVLTPNTGTPNSTFTASVTGATVASGLTYQWESAPTATGPWTDIAGATTATATITAINTFGTTYYRRKISCGSNSAWSTVVSYTTDYCTPSSTASDFYIKNVQFVGTLNPDTTNPSGYSTGGYANYKAKPEIAKQLVGEAINVQLSLQNTAANPYSSAKAWVDWDRNGIFNNDASEIVYDTGTVLVADALFGYIIPTGTAPGTYVIRIRNRYAASNGNNFDPCETLANGETEDYTFEVINPCAAQITSVSAPSNCGAGPVTITAVGNSSTTSYKWFSSEFGAAISGANGSTYTTGSLTPGSYTYYVSAVGASCEAQFRTPVKIVVKPKPNVQFTQTAPEICGSDGTIQIATSNVSEEVTLIDDHFDNLSNFVNSFGGNTEPTGAWQLYNGPHRFPNYGPAVSSGYGGGRFAAVTTDVQRNSNLLNYFSSTSNLPSTANFTTLKMDFDLYLYFEQQNNVDRGYFRVQYSTDGGGAWNDIADPNAFIMTNVGVPTRWSKISINLPAACLEQTQLRFRFVSFAYGSASEWMMNLFAIDNVRIYGDRPLVPNFTWTGDTSILFQSDCTSSITSSTTSLCIKPSATQIENDASWTVNVSATLSNSCNATGTITIPNASKTWSAANSDWSVPADWKPSGGGLPDITKCVIVKSPVTINGSTIGAAKNIEVQTGGSLTIQGNGSLLVKDFISNETGSANNFVVESDANLLQVNNVSNTGAITVKRDAHGMRYLEYTYWASPVSGQTFKSFSPTTPDARFYQYNESNDLFESIQNPLTNIFGNNRTGVFESAAKGYAIRYYGTSNLFTGTFKGVPNNGDITFPLKFKSGATGQGYGYNMVGNPYPSNIDFSKLHAANSTLIYNTAYFWTNVNPNGAMQGSNYPNGALINNYAVLNGTGGVGATSSSAVNGSQTPNQFIKVGQGFIVKAKAAGDLQFTNGDGTTGIRTANNTGHFFNNRGTTVDRFWLELKTPLDVVTTQLIGYLSAATYGFERDYDSPLLTLGADAFYSSLETYKLAIQGRGIFTATDIVPLGTSHYAAGNYTITLKEREGIFAGGQNIYLRDKQTGTVTNLTEGSYTFAANKGENTGRFEIIYEPQVVLATDSAQTDDLVVYKNQGDFVVSSQKKDIDQLEVYDAGGRLIYAAKPNKRETVINAEYLVEGVYVLKITRNGEVSVKKIVK